MVSINAYTGLFYTPVDYEEDLLQSARDRVYTVKGERRYRPNYGLEADYTALHSIPITLIQQAFKSDTRFRVNSIAAFYPNLDVRGAARPNPLNPLVLNQVFASAKAQGDSVFLTPKVSLYIPTAWALDRTTNVTKLELSNDSIIIHASAANLDIEPDSEVYIPWYVYLSYSHFSWLIPVASVPSLTGKVYTWTKTPEHINPIKSVIETYIDEEWTIGFVRVEDWLMW